jgi:hypothetical protein
VSVISCRLIGEGRSGQRATNLVGTFTQRFRVETNNPLDGPEVVWSPHSVSGHPQLPTQFVTTYSSGNDSEPLALCVGINVDEEGDSRKSWIVTAQYSTAPPGNASELSQNPLSNPPFYSLSFDQYTTVARKAVNYFKADGSINNGGDLQPIWNSAFQTLRPGVEVDDSRPVLVVERNEAIVNQTLAMFYVNSVNVSAWKGCAPRTVKCKSIATGQLQQQNQYSYYRVRYEFHMNPDTWDLRPLNQSTKFKRYTDANNTHTNGDLVKLKPGEEPVTIWTGYAGTINKVDGIVPEDAAIGDIDQIYLRYRYYRELDFSVFQF